MQKGTENLLGTEKSIRGRSMVLPRGRGVGLCFRGTGPGVPVEPLTRLGPQRPNTGQRDAAGKAADGAAKAKDTQNQHFAGGQARVPRVRKLRL